MEEMSVKEERIRKITQLYYSRKDVQENIFQFSKNREISPRYFDGFGKRPDSFQFKADIFNLVKKGATSFHCSEEIWEDPLKLITGMSEKEANDLRIGWDLLIDIDCKWFDYAKKAAQAILETFGQHGIKNVGIKFSGSKGFHLIVPWKAFPKNINGVQTSELFPELPRKVIAYVRYYSEKILRDLLPDDFYEQFKGVKIKRGFKCKKCNEVAQAYERIEFYCKFCKVGEFKKIPLDSVHTKFLCSECKRPLEEKNKKEIYECNKCDLISDPISPREKKGEFSENVETDLYEIMGLDIILVSPRHLFRMPYSLHEKTSLASVVIDREKVKDFQLKDADPMTVEVKDFNPDAKENEAGELVMQALDWAKQNRIGEDVNKISSGKYADFKPINLKKIKEDQFPPCIKKILEGMQDGKKRGLFVLINAFRSIGMNKEELEKKIYDWNDKNEVPLKKGYIHSQLVWSYKRKPIMPQNCKEFYQNLGVCTPDNLCNKIKNPVNYIMKKNFVENKKKA